MEKTNAELDQFNYQLRENKQNDVTIFLVQVLTKKTLKSWRNPGMETKGNSGLETKGNSGMGTKGIPGMETNWNSGLETKGNPGMGTKGTHGMEPKVPLERELKEPLE